MKKFILKSCLFIISVPLFILILLVYNTKIVNLEFEKTKNNLIIGNSVVAHAYNDNYLSSLINIGSQGEPYFYSYYKLNQFLKHNDHIDNLFIELETGHSAQWLWGDETIPFRLSKYLFYIDKEGYRILFNNNPKAFTFIGSFLMETVKVTVKTLIYGRKYDKVGLGGYFSPQWFWTDDILKNHIEKNSNNDSISIQYVKVDNYQTQYLDKIVDLCSKKNINIIFIRSPRHPVLKDNHSRKQLSLFVENEYANINYIDISNYILKNDECADLLHMNYKGAKRYSIWFDNLLKNGLLEKEDIQSFINEQIEIENNR